MGVAAGGSDGLRAFASMLRPCEYLDSLAINVRLAPLATRVLKSLSLGTRLAAPSSPEPLALSESSWWVSLRPANAYLRPCLRDIALEVRSGASGIATIVRKSLSLSSAVLSLDGGPEFGPSRAPTLRLGVAGKGGDPAGTSGASFSLRGVASAVPIPRWAPGGASPLPRPPAGDFEEVAVRLATPVPLSGGVAAARLLLRHAAGTVPASALHSGIEMRGGRLIRGFAPPPATNPLPPPAAADPPHTPDEQQEGEDAGAGGKAVAEAAAAGGWMARVGGLGRSVGGVAAAGASATVSVPLPLGGRGGQGGRPLWAFCFADVAAADVSSALLSGGEAGGVAASWGVGAAARTPVGVASVSYAVGTRGGVGMGREPLQLSLTGMW